MLNDSKRRIVAIDVSFWTRWATLLAAFQFFNLSLSAGFDHHHPQFAKVLSKFVDTQGMVAYSALKASSADLDAYLDDLAGVSREEFETWKEPERLAWLLNLYNAVTLQLILDHYPVKSIRSIGGLFSSPWKLKVVHIWGETFTLDQVEHEMIRGVFKEPRVHFALVCAAKSCPPLRAEPYVPSKLNAQLDDQGRIFLTTRAKNRVDLEAHILWLSPIFKWFEADFVGKNGSLLKFVTPYLAPVDAKAISTEEFRIKYTDYDWSLNEQR